MPASLIRTIPKMIGYMVFDGFQSLRVCSVEQLVDEDEYGALMN